MNPSILTQYPLNRGDGPDGAFGASGGAVDGPDGPLGGFDGPDDGPDGVTRYQEALTSPL